MLPDQMRSKIVRFRLQGQHLSHRLPPGELLQAAGACGVQNTPPSAAALSLHARLSGLTRDAVDQALEEGKTLLQTWSLRGAPTIFPPGTQPFSTQACCLATAVRCRLLLVAANSR